MWNTDSFVAHFGNGKRMLKQVVGNGVVKDERQVIESFNKVANTVQGIELQDIPNLSVTPLPDQLRKWFQFLVTETGLLACRNLKDKQWTMQRVYRDWQNEEEGLGWSFVEERDSSKQFNAQDRFGKHSSWGPSSTIIQSRLAKSIFFQSSSNAPASV